MPALTNDGCLGRGAEACMVMTSGIPITPKNDYTIKLGGQRYGFVDYEIGYGPTSM